MNFISPIQMPIDGPYDWDKFGVVRPLNIDPSGQPHTGVDLRSLASRDVVAVASGTVTVSNQSDGSWIHIDHGEGWASRYVHLTQQLPNVGKVVNQGEKIGVYGVIGLSTGAHLHFELWKDGKRVDPEPFFNQNNMLRDSLIEAVQKTTFFADNRKSQIIANLSQDKGAEAFWHIQCQLREDAVEITRLIDAANPPIDIFEALSEKKEEVASLRVELNNASQRIKELSSMQTVKTVTPEEIASLTVTKLEAKFRSLSGQLVPKPAWLEWLLGTIKNNSTVITGVLITYGAMQPDEASKLISWATAAVSFALSAVLELEKTKQNRAKNA